MLFYFQLRLWVLVKLNKYGRGDGVGFHAYTFNLHVFAYLLTYFSHFSLFGRYMYIVSSQQLKWRDYCKGYWYPPPQYKENRDNYIEFRVEARKMVEKSILARNSGDKKPSYGFWGGTVLRREVHVHRNCAVLLNVCLMAFCLSCNFVTIMYVHLDYTELERTIWRWVI